MPYVTGGLPGWAEAVRAAAEAGADAIEVGIPFSDPVMDGPVIQAASQRALDLGATPTSILDELADLDAGVPLAVMTYYNLVFRAGHERFAEPCAASGVAAAHRCPTCRSRSRVRGARPPTPPVWRPSCSPRPPRPTSACPGSAPGRGASSTPSGCSASPASGRAWRRARWRWPQRLKAVTDLPVLVGVGVSNAEQAVEAVRVADGVIQGASVVRRLMDGGVEAVAGYVAEVRAAIDAATP